MNEPVLEPSAAWGPLAHIDTVYALPDGRQCLVTFANRGTERLAPVRNDRGELWVGFLTPDGREPDRWDDWTRDWIAPELLRPVGRLGDEGAGDKPVGS